MTALVYVENNQKKKDSNSFKTAPEHKEQEPVESETLEVHQPTCERWPPIWHLEYIKEINVAYYLLTKDGEPSTFYKALNNPDVALWITAIQEEIKALHKNKI